MKKLEINGDPLNNLFFSFLGLRAPPLLRGWGSPRVVGKEEEKEAYPHAGFSSQDFPYRDNYPCQSIPVGKYLQSRRLQVFPCRNLFTGLISPVRKSLWGSTCGDGGELKGGNYCISSHLGA
jgi:hypothetical protein